MLIIYSIIFFISSLFHPFHVSVTEIEHKQETKSLEVSSRIFLDDLEEGITTQTDQIFDIVTPDDVAQRDRLVQEYVENRIKVWVNGKEKDMVYIGHEIDVDVMWCYIEIMGIKKMTKIEVENSVLLDTFDDQTNLVHITYKDKTRSLKLEPRLAKQELVF